MKKVILFMVGVLASLMLSAQSRWSVTPEAGLVVNKENKGTSVTLGFKAGAGVIVSVKGRGGKKAFFWLEVRSLYLNAERWVSSYELGKHINRGRI